MTKTRLEAFSDGVIAILITIMVLELKTPHSPGWEAVKPLLPTFGSYILSFVVIAIYWGNHHHLVHTISHVNSRILWANMHLLFWLSLIPFATGWMGETNFARNTVATYALLLTLCSIAYYILLQTIAKNHPHSRELLTPLKKQSRKGLWSLLSYAAAIPLAYVHPGISGVLFVLVTVFWLVPDRDIEKTLEHN